MPAVGHALLSASSAHRWLACPPSAQLCAQAPEGGTSEAAAEGTLAHSICEAKINAYLKGKKPRTPAKLTKHELYRKAMEEHTDGFVDYVIELYDAAQRRSPDALLLTEQRLDFGAWVPDGFGTGDVIIISDGVMDVVDFKYGKGVPVSAENNPQLRLYGLGALAEFSSLYEIDMVRLHIFQPRLDSVTMETLHVEALLEWGNRILTTAQQAAEGKGEFKAGEHCRFCRVAATCRARAEKQLELAKYEFADAPLLSNAEIGEILARVDELTAWAKSVKDYAAQQAIENDEHFDGWKLVAGRSVRKITDEEQAVLALLDSGYKTTDVMRIKGLTDLEELVGKKALASLLGDLIVKPEGKPTLVPETDKRPEWNSAKQDFNDDVTA